ncbi:MAG: hypothetical protein RMY28_002685 [Nostoc sp. ChiSLP01]|nr:hypothetical protein [Nostoc sp. CmiSLP01]MDZ8285339.1 hypothetical protein [Nostoc sp. ChiSLP01]
MTELTVELRNELKQYNQLLNTLDSAKEKIEALEKGIRETSERLVSGVASKYGKDSREYELAGAVRKSDAYGGLRLRVRKAMITRLKSNAQAKATAT